MLSRNSGALRLAAGQLQRRPSVSVVIPCYNYARYLPDAVASALGQADVDVDVLIVDDASTDGSGQLALELASADARIRPVLHAENMGHIATYNDGLSRAVGEYVVLLSADDVLAPGSLARSTALMENHPEVGLVYGFAEEFSETVPPSPGKRASWSIWRGEEWIGVMCRRGSNIIMNPEAVLRRTVMEQLSGYRADMPHAADMDLWLRAAAITGVGRVNGPVQAYYRVHGQNMHLTDFNATLDDIRARREVFDELFAVSLPTLKRPRRYQHAARKALATEAVLAAIHLSDSEDALPGHSSALADFAAQTDSTITASPLWASYLRRSSGDSSIAERTLFELVYRWRWSLQWRRWRRSGI